MEPLDFTTEITGLTLSSMDKMNIGYKDSYIKSHELEIPENFNTIVIKLCPEIKDIVIVGYKQYSRYNETSLKAIPCFMVGIDLFLNENQIPKGDRTYYDKVLNDYFRLTYGNDMNFVIFDIESLSVFSPKSNLDKFIEFFKKK
jgi:hypothetical protein